MRKKSENATEKNEERGLLGYFLRPFAKYDFRDEKQFVTFGKWLIFIVLLIVEAFIVLQHLSVFDARNGWGTLMGIVILESVLTLSKALKITVVKGNLRLIFYVLDLLAACGFLFVTEGSYPVLVYMLVLTEFYIGVQKTVPSVVLLCIGMPLYAASYALRVYIQLRGEILLFDLLMQAFQATFALLLHFLVVQIGLAFYRQYVRLNKTLKELDESKKELEKAYEVVAEVTALEERQRIAKEIHDTAGHSITTVIMQTEAAKLILPDDPEKAKHKIVAANLQAKHALEELRDSVHLLSGSTGNTSLKAALEGIVHESTDGTDIKIRSQIEDVGVSPSKFRFLCNTLKEGISNGLRHGGATAFWFELKREEGKICFLLSDNGQGVGTDSLALGFGLSSMQERARALGGEVRFESEAGEGFEIHLTLPTDTEEE